MKKKEKNNKKRNKNSKKIFNKKSKKTRSLLDNQITNNLSNHLKSTTSNFKIIKNKKTKNNNIENNSQIIKKVKNIMEQNLKEKNNMPYEIALKNDKRSFLQYYVSLIQTKHILIFSFIYSKDYNSKIIKIDLFFIYFIIYFTVNALFFTDNTMHKIYTDEGVFNFLYQIPQIVYSFIISTIIDFLITFFSLSEDNILDL